MKRWIGVSLVWIALGWSGIAQGADSSATLGDRVSALEQKLQGQKFTLSGLLGIDFSGYVDATYMFNFNQPDSGENGLRVFDYMQSNGFEFHAAQLGFRRAASLEGSHSDRAGFGVKLMFGNDAQVIAPFSENTEDVDHRSLVDVEEAYAEYIAAVGEGLTLKGGKYVTLAGAEVIESTGNYNVSRSMLFGLAIPFTHTGIRATYPVSSAIGLTAGVVNGWDTLRDDNKGKTLELGMSVTPNDMLGMTAAVYYGEEIDPTSGMSDGRFLIDTVITVKPTETVTLVLNGDYGTQENGGLGLATGDNNAKWYGLAGYVNVAVTDRVGVTLRTEIFRDGNGSRTGAEMTAWEATATASYKVTENLETRVELRHDAASVDAFDRKDLTGVKGTQDTIAAQVLYTF